MRKGLGMPIHARMNGRGGFTIVEIALGGLVLAVVAVILWALFFRSPDGGQVFSFLRSVVTAPTTPPVDVHGDFTLIPPRFLAIRRPQPIRFTLTVLPANTQLNPDGSIPAGVTTVPLSGVSVTLGLTGPVTFRGGRTLTVITDAQGHANAEVFGSDQEGTATVKATVTLKNDQGNSVTASEERSVPVESP